jgi:EAL domain-containing protein (putative c-di-GMP-specific phosphodiesterase class I)
MGVRTVAEGVEDAEMLAAIALIGVDFVQGSHLSPAVPLEQMLPQEGAVTPLLQAMLR